MAARTERQEEAEGIPQSSRITMRARIKVQIVCAGMRGLLPRRWANLSIAGLGLRSH
jgi:hypothetical protein